MELEEHSEGNVQVLRLSGRFDSYTAAPVRDWLEKTASQTPANIVVDLKNVNFVDSTGLASLVQGMKRCRQQNGDLRLSSLQRSVRMIFELTRLDKAFEIFNSEEEAVAAFQLAENEAPGS